MKNEDRQLLNVGVSSCLLGENVRWNGGHQLNHFIRDILGTFVRFVPVCPEFECGLGVPRETLRLTGNPESPRLVTNRTGIDMTERMVKWAEGKIDELSRENLCGFIFKSKSPSSGLFKVKVYNDKGNPVRTGTGIFARMFVQSFPLVPVEEDGRLADEAIRENFIERIFVFKRWRDMLENDKHPRYLMDFHTRHKYLIMAHSPRHYQILGKHVANVSRTSIADDYKTYEALLSEALELKATPAKHVNVLHHIAGYFKSNLSSDEKQELIELIGHYKTGAIPLIVPVTLLNHYVRKYNQPYLMDQVYLNPHPLELKLRNHT